MTVRRAPSRLPKVPQPKSAAKPPWLVGFWRGVGHSLVTTAVGALVIEATAGSFNLRDIAVPLLVLVQRTLEGVKDQKAV